jgi:hypothetical protein
MASRRTGQTPSAADGILSPRRSGIGVFKKRDDWLDLIIQTGMPPHQAGDSTARLPLGTLDEDLERFFDSIEPLALLLQF